MESAISAIMWSIHINKPLPPTERIHSNFKQSGRGGAA
jgi:hypothetical protein